MKNKRIGLIAVVLLIASVFTGCQSVSKAKYQALHESFSSYVKSDTDKRIAVSKFIENELKSAETSKDESRIKRLKLQRLSIKSWSKRQSKAESYLDNNIVD